MIRNGFRDNRERIFLAISILLVLILRTSLAVKLGYATIKGDELLHWGLSKSIFAHGQTYIRMFPVDRFSSLYSILIAWVHIFQGCEFQYAIARVANSLYMISTLIPVYLLAKKVLQERKLIWIAVVVTAVLPEFAYNARILQENILFPIAIWTFYFVYKMYCSEKIRTRDIIVTAISSFFCYWAKEAGISIVLAILCSLIFNMFYERRTKEKVRPILIYIVSFGSIYIVFHGIYKLMNPNIDKMFLVSNALMNFNMQYILKWIRGGFHYLIILIMIVGFSVIILPFVGFRYLKKEEQKTIMFTLFATFWAIVESVCMIYVGEHMARIHIRYLFYVIPIIWIFFLKTCKTLHLSQIKLMRKEKVFLFFCFITSLVLSVTIGIFVSPGSVIDGNSNRHMTNNYIALAMGIERYQVLINSILVVFTIFTILLLIKSQYMKLLYMEVVFFCFIQLMNNFLCYHDEYLAKCTFNAAAKEYEAVNEFLNQNISEDDTVALMSRGFSGSTIELHLDRNNLYYIDWDTCVSDINYDDGTIKDNQLGFTYWSGISKGDLPEIMIVDNWITERYALLSYQMIFETENHKVLKKVNDKFKIEILIDYDIQGTTGDGWITNQEALLTIRFKENVNEINLIYNSVMPGAALAIRDEVGNETVFNLEDYNGEISYPVSAVAGDVKTLIIYGAKTVKPSDVGLPDDRELCVVIEDVIVK